MHDESTPIINGYPGDPENDVSGEVPNDLDDFMISNGVADKYSCLIRSYSYVSSTYEQVRKTEGVKPDTDKIGIEFGPGKYAVMFSWRGIDGPTGKSKTFGKEFKFTIGEAYREAHEDFIRDRNESRKKRDRERLALKKEEATLSHIENGGNGAPGIDPIEAAERMLQKNLDMAIKLGQLNQPRGNDDMFKMIMAMQATASENMMKMMLGMMNMMNGNRAPAPESSTDMAMKFMGMTKELLLMKRDLDEPEEEKESVGEKVFNTLVGFVPNLLDLAGKSMEARNNNILLNAAKGSGEYKTLKSDPAALAVTVNKLDAKFSPKQTDKILEVMGLPRPEATKVNYEKYGEPEDEESKQETEG